MTDDVPDADALASAVLPLDGPYPPERVVEAARTVAELVRRLNHATRHAHSLGFSSQLDSTIGALRSAMYGLDQTFTQLAGRLDVFAADPRVYHDDQADPWADSAEAAHHLRSGAEELSSVCEELDRACRITHHLGYDTSTPRSRPHTFPTPDQPSPTSSAPPQPPVSIATRDRHR